MSADCQFPGCENDASATYCEECRGAVRPHRTRWQWAVRKATWLFFWIPLELLLRRLYYDAKAVRSWLDRWFP